MSITFHATNRGAGGAHRGLLLGLCALALLVTPAAQATNLTNLTVTGVSADGVETPVTQYRWLVEKDETYHVQTTSTGAAIPTVFDPDWKQLTDGIPGGETLSVGFHDSYTPVVAKGCVGFGDVTATGFECPELISTLLPNTHYYVSVVPRAGYSIGGVAFTTDGSGIPPVGTEVFVNEHPIPTAQITVLIFHDNAPINNAPDLPSEEPGLGPGQTDMSGFKLIVEDAGGRWGASAGVQSQDAFGNPLGTQYDAAGNVIGYEPLITGPDGRITIKNLAPGKYGIMAVPPAGQAWQQTSTIEGTKIIDAWVKANEPPFFAEFGPAGFHVFIGFVQPFNDIPTGGGATLTGAVVNQHLSRPPDYALYNGGCFGHTTPWIGLNDMAVGIGTGVYAAPTGDDCSFEIPNVPDGNYQLVAWDNNLDLLFAFKGITIVNGECLTPSGCSLGEFPVFQWFHRQEHFVYDDLNGNGYYEPGLGETPILEQDVALRWRDGTVYQGNVTDPAGLYAFDQVFPFFSWLVAETGFVRFEATGLTYVVDDGGAVPFNLDGSGIFPDEDLSFGGMTTPQVQTNPADPDCVDPTVCVETATHRIDFGPVLTAGVQGFLGQTNAFQWGKRHYADGENGGISGIVFYAVTRAENDPELAAAEPWEPGIPGVEVNLYSLGGDMLPNTPDDVLLNTTTTDSWDDSIPTGCKYGDSPENSPFMFDPDGAGPIAAMPQDCYDGLRAFNQIRPAVFDGGYAFDATCPGGMTLDVNGNPFTDLDGNVLCSDGGSEPIGPMPVGDYVVEVVAPLGYELLKPEDKNVDFGDVYDPAPELLPPPCVGDLHTVPAILPLFPDEAIPAPFAGEQVELCDKKLVTLSQGANAAADFWLFTEVPVAAKGFGFILDDTQNEFDPNSPQFGEKYAPPFVPVTVRDWTGRVLHKTLSDQYGRYNFMAPSTITTNLPAPSGMSPNMLTTCMNDPGDDPINPDPNWNQQYSTFCYTFQYMPGVTTYLDTPVVPVAAFTGGDQFPLDCEYPDGTPRLYSVNVGTNGVGGGPYIPTYEVTSGQQAGRGTFIEGEQIITLTSMGQVSVQNPDYCNPAAGACPAEADTINKFVIRDHGFGASGTVTLGDLGDLTCTWGAQVTCTIPADTRIGDPGAMGGRQLTVTRDNGRSTKAGITVQVGLRDGAIAIPVGPPTPGNPTPIQDAIQVAGTNDLLLVKPGTYNELVVMWKPIQLQGWGEGSTIINAVKAPPEKLITWRDLVNGLIGSGAIDLLPGQEIGGGAPEPVTLWTEEGAGILVLASASGGSAFDDPDNIGARIDGFTVKSADTGGGMVVNGYARYLEISNNRVSNNQGFYHGGIRVGHPTLTNEADGVSYTDAENDYVNIHHNQVVFNGGQSQNGAGGGISMCTGADSYRITDNWVCGNFSLSDGGGIAHYGLSDGAYTFDNQAKAWVISDRPLIEDNVIIFNENFFQGATVSGGGVFIGGAAPLTPGGLTPGAGNVQLIGNLIQGNGAGAGDGGGARLAGINGQDVAANPDNGAPQNQNDPIPWYGVDVFNNMLVNNVAGLAGGGLSLQDAVKVRLVHNTIANNDSVATAGEAFAPGSPNQSTPQQGAGVVTRTHSAALAGIPGTTVGTFSDPSVFADNIIWHNRQFYFWLDPTSGCTPGDPDCTSTFGLCPDPTGDLACPTGTEIVYDDLGVIGSTDCLGPTFSILTDLAEDDPDCSYNAGANNIAEDPTFVAEYVNGARSSVLQNEVTTVIEAPAAFDEGGNFIRPKYGPLSLYDDELICTDPEDPDTCSPDGLPGVLFGDYHIQSESPAVGAIDLTTPPLWWVDELGFDYDGELRPGDSVFADIGADEQSASPVNPLNQERTPGSAEVGTKARSRAGE